jgi:diadenosine tetraphosphate (Ap4A) HIT family hydrolase
MKNNKSNKKLHPSQMSSPTQKPCPFCTLPTERIIDSNEFGVTIRDGFPVTLGHTLVIPKRHVGSWFETSKEEQKALMELLTKAQKVLEKEFSPDGYNIGINDGPAAGQTVPHLHMHLIPRYKGDQEDARGGVRWIIPEKAKYWE